MTKGAVFDSLVNAEDLGAFTDMTEKAVPLAADLLVAADSAATYVRKKVQIGNLPFSASSHSHSHTALSDIGTNTHAQLDTHIAAANPHSGSQPVDATLTAVAGLTITQGSLIVGTGADAFTVLAKGTTLQALCMNVGATAPEWVNVTGTGSVVRASGPTIDSLIVTTSLRIPSAADPTVSAAGDVAVCTDGTIRIHDGTAERVLTAKHKLPIRVGYPNESQNTTGDYFPSAITITRIRPVVVGASTPSVTWALKHATTRDAVSPTQIKSATTTTTAGDTDITSFDDATIPAGSWVWITCSAVSGSVYELFLDIEYRIDP